MEDLWAWPRGDLGERMGLEVSIDRMGRMVVGAVVESLLYRAWPACCEDVWFVCRYCRGADEMRWTRTASKYGSSSIEETLLS